jgi:Zn-dependent protease/CBS domain-containing protein
LKGSFRIAKIFGIPVELHWTFALILLWIVYSSYMAGASITGIMINVAFLLSLFACVVLHEFGHALTARRFGVKTRDIILSPIGGIARLDRLPEKPMQEFLVAVAGPLVNIAIAILLMPYLLFKPIDGFLQDLITLSVLREGITEFVPGLIALNFLLAAFNLLPAFPMDGGRILRSLLAIKMERVLATKVAARIGQAFAVLFILWAFLPDEVLANVGLSNGGLLTAFIGLFVFLTANQEMQSARLDAILSGGLVKEVMRTEFTLVHEDDPVWIPISYFRQGTESYFLVANREGLIVGALQEEALLLAMKNNQTNLEVSELMIPGEDIQALEPEETLKAAYAKFQQSSFSILPVKRDQEIIGVLDIKLVTHYLELQKKLGQL